MTSLEPDPWELAKPYERYMGRWSRRVAAEFLQWLPTRPARSWCDVGCGTGALAHAVLSTEDPARVIGVEPSEGFAAAAGAAIDDPRFELRAGSAVAIPAADGEFDRVVSALVVNFVPDPTDGLVEMRRVTRPGGTVAGYVWDYAEGMQMIRAFWDVAGELDEAAKDLDEGVRFPFCTPEALSGLLSSAGLARVEVHPIEIPTVFDDFDDYWQPFLGGQGPAPGYCTSLPEQHRLRLRDALRARLGTKRIALRARAWAFRGVSS